MTTWTVTETFEFIELYRNRPCIWNPKDKQHKDKNRVNDSWKQISNEMGISVVELKKKKETLMTAFRSHLKKKNQSIRSGEDIYKPIWMFYDAMEIFLKDVYNVKSIVNTEEEVVYVDAEELEQTGDSRIQVADPRPSHKERTETSRRESFRLRKRRATNPPELQEVHAKVNSAFQTFNEMPSKNDDESDEECALYCRLLAVKLKQFSPLQRTELMYEIDGLILRKRQWMCSKSTASSPHSSFPSPSQHTSHYSIPISKEESGDTQTLAITGSSVDYSHSRDILSAICESAVQEYVLPHSHVHK